MWLFLYNITFFLNNSLLSLIITMEALLDTSFVCRWEKYEPWNFYNCVKWTQKLSKSQCWTRVQITCRLLFPHTTSKSDLSPLLKCFDLLQNLKQHRFNTLKIPQWGSSVSTLIIKLRVPNNAALRKGTKAPPLGVISSRVTQIWILYLATPVS